MAVKGLSRDLPQAHLRVFSSWEAERSSTMQGPNQHWSQPTAQGRVPVHRLLTFCRQSRQEEAKGEKRRRCR